MPSYNANLTPPPNTWGTGPDGRPKLQLPPGVLEMLANRQGGTQPGLGRNPRSGGFVPPGSGRIPMPMDPNSAAREGELGYRAPLPAMSPGDPNSVMRAGEGPMNIGDPAQMLARLQGVGGGMPPTGQLNVMPDRQQLRGLMDYLSR